MGDFVLGLLAPPAFAQARIVHGVPTLFYLEDTFIRVVQVATALAGMALFAILIVGGFKYMTAGGDPKASSQARNTITYALLGMTLVVASYLILRLIQEFTGVDVTIFRIYRLR